MKTRDELINWLEEYINLLPPHILVVMTYSQPIEKQKTFILKQIYEYWNIYLNQLLKWKTKIKHYKLWAW